MTNSIISAVAHLSSVSLQELDAAQLHDRIESKILITTDEVPDVLAALSSDYFVLEHADTRIQGYENQYFDCRARRNYHDHHNQNGKRIKVRYRTYANSDLTFFEIKRSVHGRTVKHRRRSRRAPGCMHQNDAVFLYRHTRRRPSLLMPSLRSSYDRVLLVRSDFSERVTIDVNLSFADSDTAVRTPKLAICEFKQPHYDRRSPAMVAVRRRPQTFSKYCMGLATCDPSLPRNRFKRVFRVLDKMGVEPVVDATDRPAAPAESPAA